MKDIVIHCIGDSHVSVFTGKDTISDGYPCPNDSIPYFRTYRLGPYLAYNIGNENHEGHRKMLGILRGIPVGSHVLLSFGEIDCRRHAVRQAEIQKRDLSEIVTECAEVYFKAVLKVKSMGYTTMVWAAVPTCNFDNKKFVDGDSWGYYGTYVERNKATSLFNTTLKKLCKNNSIPFISIEDHLINSDYRSVEDYFMDSCHLSSKCIPLIISKIEAFYG